MLLLVVSSWHIVAMAAVTILVICERLDDASAVSWPCHGFGTVQNRSGMGEDSWPINAET